MGDDSGQSGPDCLSCEGRRGAIVPRHDADVRGSAFIMYTERVKPAPSPLWRFARRRGRVIGLCCVFAYVVAATGAIPLPRIGAWLAGVTGSGEAYPCAGHGCGCHSAQDCLEHCCCYTPAERLAWAKARKLPRAVAAVEEVVCGAPDEAEEGAAEAPVANRSCCSGHGEEDDAGDEGRAVASREAGTEPVGAPEGTEEGDGEDDGALAAGWGYQLSPLRCKSVDSWLLVAVPFSDLLSGRAWLPPARLVGVRRAPAGAVVEGRALDVAVPPPRA